METERKVLEAQQHFARALTEADEVVVAEEVAELRRKVSYLNDWRECRAKMQRFAERDFAPVKVPT